jgi:signal recognition particle GTPase
MTLRMLSSLHAVKIQPCCNDNNDLLQDLVIFVMDSSIGQAAHDQAAAFRESVDVSKHLIILHSLFCQPCTHVQM